MSAIFHNAPYAARPQILAKSSHSRRARFAAPGREDLRDASKTSAAEARNQEGNT